MSQPQNDFCSFSPLFPSSCPHRVDEARSKNTPNITETHFPFVSETRSMVDPHCELAVNRDKDNLFPEIEKAGNQPKEFVDPLEERSPCTEIAHQSTSAHLSIGSEAPDSPRLTACVLRDASVHDLAASMHLMHSSESTFPVTWARCLPEEPSADPSMLGSRGIFNHRLVYDDDGDKIEYFPFNLGLVKEGYRHEDKRNGASANGSECDSQAPTPALSEDAPSSTSRDTSPATPSDVNIRKVAVSKRRIAKGKRRDAPQPPDHPTSTRTSHKRKAKWEDGYKEPRAKKAPRMSVTTQTGAVNSDKKQRKTRKTTEGAVTNDKKVRRPGDVLSTDFLRYRFDIKDASNLTYHCPFPSSMALQKRECNAVFRKEGLRTHISHHVKAFRKNKNNSGRLLPCPYDGYDECKWGVKAPTELVDPNSGLSRHVVQVHLDSEDVVCVCDSTICRGDRGQIVRHLRTDEHKAKMRERRTTDPNIRYYPDVDDGALLSEEREWFAQNEIHAVEEDRGEGSSSSPSRRPAKRHRSK